MGTRTPDKEVLKTLVTFYESQILKLGIELLLNTTATPELIKTYQPDALFVGTGGTPIIPPIRGLRESQFLTVKEVLAPDFSLTDKKIVVVSGGMTGCEVAGYLALMGNQVTLVEKQKTLASEVSSDNLVTVLKNLKKYHATLLTGYQLFEVQDYAILVKNLANGEILTVENDALILSLGNRPDGELCQKLSDDFDKVFLIGDALQTGRVANAVYTSFGKAYTLK